MALGPANLRERPRLRGAGAPHHNLPAELSSFVGREQDLAELVRRLGGARLLSITGGGGIGKTRLALRLAADTLEVFRDGVWLVELAALAEPAQLSHAVAAVLNIRLQPGRPALMSLADAIGSGQLLLVLDNCEHIVQSCAELVDCLLRMCPALRVLTTSREPLGVTGEFAWGLQPLPAPGTTELSAHDIGRFEAVQLFVERAQAVSSTMSVPSPDTLKIVGEICRRLDGIPLAIELAAALAPVLSVAEIAAGLDHRFDLLTRGARLAPRRQQTLRATVEWSYDLLSDAERQLLRWTSVFAGGWTLEAVETICRRPESDTAGTSHPTPSELGLLGRLVSKSLVLRSPSDTGHSRYRLLETIRAFARDELARSGQEPSIRQTHAAYFLAAAEEWGDAAGRGPDRTLWLDRLQEELPNLREAVRWTIQEQREDDTRMRWAKAMSSFGFLRDHFAEVYAWNVALGAVPGAGRPSLRRARALVATAVVACTGQIDFAVAGACCEEALPILLANQDALWLIRAYVNLAESLAHRGDYDPAQAASEAALAWSRQVGDRIREAMSLGTLAQIAFARADWSRARSLANASLEIANEVGDTFNQGESYRQLGDVARALGELPTARLQYEAGLERAVQLGHRQTQANALFGLGYTYLVSKEQARAGSLFIEGLTLARQVGLRLEIAAGLEGLGVLAAYKGQPERALALVGGAAALRETTCAPLSPGARWLLDSSLRPTGVALGDPGTSETLLRGRVMPLEMVFALALDSEPPTEASHIELPGGLTRREREVAGLIGRGLTNRQIAERLVITQRTVAAHIEHILEKLEFRSRLQIGLWWAQHDPDTAGTG